MRKVFFLKRIIFILLALFSCFNLYADVNLYFQKALTARIVGNPIIDEKRNTITVLTKDKWLTTYAMNFSKKYSYRLDRVPYPYLVKNFNDGYYVITVRNEVQKIVKGKLQWKYRLSSAPAKAFSISNRYILIPLVNETVLALNDEDGEKIFDVKMDGKPASSPVVLGNGNFYIANENNVIFAFDSWGIRKWTAKLPSLPLSVIVNTSNEIMVGHRSGHVVIFDSDTGDVLNSVNLHYSVHFLFEKFNGEYIAISDTGVLFNLKRNLESKFMKNLEKDVKEAVLYNNKNLFLITGVNEAFVLDEDFNFQKKDNSLKKVSGLSANSGLIATGGLDWVLTVYYYPYLKELDVAVWNHKGGNNYSQNRIGLEKIEMGANDKTYLILNEMLNSRYSSKLYDEFLEILSSLTTKYDKLSEEYLNIYKKALNNWLIPSLEADRIIQRGEIYRYFSYVDSEDSIKSYVNYALKEKNIDNVVKIVKNISKFENYYNQDIIVYNYIKYVVRKYQGNLDIAYAVISNLRKIILNSNKENLVAYKNSYIDLLRFMQRQNFSENINKYINEIIRSL